LATRRDQLHEQMAAAATDPARLLELQADLASVSAELGAAEDEWLERSLELE
jgi:ABC transport system ATP-binding/permease protein